MPVPAERGLERERDRTRVTKPLKLVSADEGGGRLVGRAPVRTPVATVPAADAAVGVNVADLGVGGAEAVAGMLGWRMLALCGTRKRS